VSVSEIQWKFTELVKIAPLKKSSNSKLTEILWLFPEYQRRSPIQIWGAPTILSNKFEAGKTVCGRGFWSIKENYVKGVLLRCERSIPLPGTTPHLVCNQPSANIAPVVAWIQTRTAAAKRLILCNIVTPPVWDPFWGTRLFVRPTKEGITVALFDQFHGPLNPLTSARWWGDKTSR